MAQHTVQPPGQLFSTGIAVIHMLEVYKRQIHDLAHFLLGILLLLLFKHKVFLVLFIFVDFRCLLPNKIRHFNILRRLFGLAASEPVSYTHLPEQGT